MEHTCCRKCNDLQGDQSCEDASCPCHSPTPESAAWEKEFDEKFVRDDGLMDKYYFDDDTEEEEFGATVIKKWLREKLTLALEQGRREGRNEAVDYIYKTWARCPIGDIGQMKIYYDEMMDTARGGSEVLQKPYQAKLGTFPVTEIVEHPPKVDGHTHTYIAELPPGLKQFDNPPKDETGKFIVNEIGADVELLNEFRIKEGIDLSDVAQPNGEIHPVEDETSELVKAAEKAKPIVQRMFGKDKRCKHGQDGTDCWICFGSGARDETISKEPYYMRDHIHCFDQKEAPCGLKTHTKCCLCEKPATISKEEVRSAVEVRKMKHDTIGSIVDCSFTEAECYNQALDDIAAALGVNVRQ